MRERTVESLPSPNEFDGWVLKVRFDGGFPVECEWAKHGIEIPEGE